MNLQALNRESAIREAASAVGWDADELIAHHRAVGDYADPPLSLRPTEPAPPSTEPYTLRSEPQPRTAR